MAKSPRARAAVRSRRTSEAKAGARSPGLSAAVPMLKFAQEMRRWPDNVLGIAGSATELSLNLAQARAKEPRQRQAIEEAGSLLRQARETAGMTKTAGQ